MIVKSVTGFRIRKVAPVWRVCMFAEGDYISYSCYGVCKVEGTTMMDVPGGEEPRMYYILKPVYENSGTVYSSVENVKLLRRPILTKAEANSLLKETSHLEPISTSDKKQLEEQCKVAVPSGECVEWMKVIKPLTYERLMRQQQGKKMTATNERYLKNAMDKLCGELAVVLEQDKSQVEEMLEELLKQSIL